MTVSYDRLNERVRDKFGIDSTYTPDGGIARTVVAVVERDYFSETVGVGIQTESLVLKVVDSDVPEIAVGDVFSWASGSLAGTYTVVEVKPDFHGMTDVVINKV